MLFTVAVNFTFMVLCSFWRGYIAISQIQFMYCIVDGQTYMDAQTERKKEYDHSFYGQWMVGKCTEMGKKLGLRTTPDGYGGYSFDE